LRGLPGSSRLLHTRSRRIYMRAPLTAIRTLDCVAPSSLCLMPQIRLRRRFRRTNSCTSARVFTSDFLKGLLRVDPLSSASLSHCQAWNWTNSLIAPNPNVMLDAQIELGTLAKRTSKQPGVPGTHSRACTLLPHSAAKRDAKRWHARRKEVDHITVFHESEQERCPQFSVM